MATTPLNMSDKRTYIVHPYKFNLWLFLLTVIMVFGGLTSAYIVARAAVPAAERIYFELPSILWVNLAVVLVSSVTMQLSVRAARQDKKKEALGLLTLTTVLGLIFLWGQLEAFSNMVDRGYYMVNGQVQDQSVAFFYVFVGLHGAHMIGAVSALVFANVKTWLNAFKPGNRVLTYEVTAIFWHFLGLLWVYLFVFLLYTQS